jgi:hypothetical protein
MGDFASDDIVKTGSGSYQGKNRMTYMSKLGIGGGGGKSSLIALIFFS